MRKWHISRRTFLRGATGAALGLPLLEVMEPRSARAASKATPPLRMGCIYMPNGVPNEAWRPESKDGRLTKMNPWMEAFEPLKNDIQFLAGLQSVTNGSHPGAGATWLVRPCAEGDGIGSTKDVGSPSMDQIVARSIGDETPFSSLELISRPQGTFSKSLLRNNISWRNGTTPVPRETEPRAVYDRLTGRGAEGQNAAETNWQQSILDTVLADAQSLRNRISTSDQHKLDEYLDAVRGVEKQMSRMASESRASAREKAATFPRPPEGIPEDHGAYLRLMFDMMVLAYWTDSTRVASFMLDHEQSNRYVNFIPEVKGMWHAISHWRDISGKTEDDDGKTSWSSKEVKFKQYLTIIKFHQEQVAYFLNRLKNIEEGDGSLLDHSMILYGAPFSDGNEHLSKNLPMLIAGKAGGKIAPGRILEYPDGPAEGVYLSMMDVMGVPVHELGGIDTAVAIT
ncbi:MAG: DUF1552 domain-containing protein [Candidatus Hydrogenedentota bacterium]